MSNPKKSGDKTGRSGPSNWSDSINKSVNYAVALGALSMVANPNIFIRACEKATFPAHHGCKTLPQDTARLVSTFISTATSSTMLVHSPPVFTNDIRGVAQVYEPREKLDIAFKFVDDDKG
jgi:hypothetical protein